MSFQEYLQQHYARILREYAVNGFLLMPVMETSAPEPKPEAAPEQPDAPPAEVLTAEELDRAEAVRELIRRGVYTDGGA